MVCVYLLISFAVTVALKYTMPVLYDIKARKYSECDEMILKRITGLKTKEENEATGNCIKRNFVNLLYTKYYWVMKSRKV